MAEYEDPELTSHRHNKITPTYRETIYEDDLKISRKFPQLKRSHNEIGRRARDMV